MAKEKAVEYACNAFREVMDAYSGEKLLILCDDVRRDVGWIFAEAGLETGLNTRLITLKTNPKEFRKKLPESLIEAIVQTKPDVAVNCLRGPAEETLFRIKLIHLETKDKTVRLGHGPGITLDMLTEGALALNTEEYQVMNTHSDEIIALTEGAKEIRITTPGGTDVRLSIERRGFFKDMNITREKWGNLPTGEVAVGPIENSLEGILVCDMAIGGIGLLKKPVTIVCKEGKAQSVRGDDEGVVSKVKENLSIDQLASVVGEMAIGMNPKARVIKEFLETEKVYGTAHIAFGSNIDYPTGGKNNSANHMDFLMDKPTVVASFSNGREREIVATGRIIR
ncbi:MAG: hypothetical protein QG670_810 [Thermoproteota archaeon]|nr:hypothetical protein [Thermoproteota archaeon]